MKTTPETPPVDPISRRNFVQGAVSAASTLAVAGTFPTGALAAPAGPQTAWSLVAENISQLFGDGVSVPIARYRPDAGGPSNGALPLLEAQEGSRVLLKITNNTPLSIRPMIQGVGPLAIIRPGQVGGLRFRMPAAGTYLLGSDGSDLISDETGLGAMVISRPSGGLQELWNGGPAYDREYRLLYQDIDSRWSTKVQQLVRPDLSDFEPNYFIVNGLRYPDTVADAHTAIHCNVGERVLIRFGNAGRMRQSIHFHGYHVEILARNNQPEIYLPAKDTFGLPQEGTVDALLTPHQSGVYPLHPHSLTAVTSNGLYPFGQLTLITAV